LHPEKYLANEQPREVEADFEGFADEGWRLTATTPLGEIGVRGLLMAGVAGEEAKRAAAGWGGDRAFVFEREGRAPLFVWKTAWDKTTRRAGVLPRLQRAAAAARRARRGRGATRPSAVWRDGALVTRVRIEGDSVTVVRGRRRTRRGVRLATSKLTFGTAPAGAAEHESRVRRPGLSFRTNPL
jgi:hypothetical protein